MVTNLSLKLKLTTIDISRIAKLGDYGGKFFLIWLYNWIIVYSAVTKIN